MRQLLAMMAFLVLGACLATGPVEVGRVEVDDLAAAIGALGPDVDPAEARRAAEIAYRHTRVLAVEYEITDPPLIHNTKVNMGLKPRGLCWHWAEDMETRLAAEDFETLDLHRAIANADNPVLIDHSTAIIAAQGAAWDAGIVLDPWRLGGRLYWTRLKEDINYPWRERGAVLEERRAHMVARGLLEGAY